MKSIISNNKECIICFSKSNIQKHHIYYGEGRRKISEKEGCWCYLCTNHHTLSDMAVHSDKELDLRLKKQCQVVWESLNGSREDFIKEFGKSYL